MSGLFQRQLVDYVEYHRDPWNCAMHVVGIVALFLGAVLPLSLVHVPLFGLNVSLAVILALPVLIYWLFLDTALGLGILCGAILLLTTAAQIVEHCSATTMWSIFAVLIPAGVAAQTIGHKVFEQRKASMADHPAHFLLGPMFVMAKLFVAFGFRHDLAAIIESPAAARN
jgi:uncharacterized membrane protein YGL010W